MHPDQRLSFDNIYYVLYNHPSFLQLHLLVKYLYSKDVIIYPFHILSHNSAVFRSHSPYRPCPARHLVYVWVNFQNAFNHTANLARSIKHFDPSLISLKSTPIWETPNRCGAINPNMCCLTQVKIFFTQCWRHSSRDSIETVRGTETTTAATNNYDGLSELTAPASVEDTREEDVYSHPTLKENKARRQTTILIK